MTAAVSSGDGEDSDTKKKLDINGAEVDFLVLEGEEETTFLDKCLSDMTENRNKSRGGGHKRRGGFQGRGGGYAKRARK